MYIRTGLIIPFLSFNVCVSLICHFTRVCVYLHVFALIGIYHISEIRLFVHVSKYIQRGGYYLFGSACGIPERYIKEIIFRYSGSDIYTVKHFCGYEQGFKFYIAVVLVYSQVYCVVAYKYSLVYLVKIITVKSSVYERT